jgi:hypothetical protein
MASFDLMSLPVTILKLGGFHATAAICIGEALLISGALQCGQRRFFWVGLPCAKP